MKYCSTCSALYPQQTQYCPVHGSPLEAKDEFGAGSVIRGRYEIQEKMGGGAMGEVFLIRDREAEPGRDVRAMKVPRPELLTDKAYLARFRHEANSTLRLFHENIVRCYNIEVTESGTPLLLMEFVPGSDLRSWMTREHRLRWGHIKEIAIQMAKALEHAHAAGLVHCDIKPENVLSVWPEHPVPVKVLDFGLAKAARAPNDGRTAVQGGTVWGGDVVAGTLNYMSPEQALGRDQVGPPSDIYSMGAVLFEMITGRLPYGNLDSFDAARSVHAGRQAESIVTGYGVPAGVSALLNRMLDREPARRPTASEVCRALEILDAPTPPPPSSAQPQRIKTVNTNRLSSSVFVIAGVVVVCVVGIFLLLLAKPSGADKPVYTYLKDKQEQKTSLSPDISTGPTATTEPFTKLPSRPTEPPRPVSATVVVTCDLDCVWSIDGGSRQSGEGQAAPGHHRLRATMVANNNVWEEKEADISAGRPYRFQFDLTAKKKENDQKVEEGIANAKKQISKEGQFQYGAALATLARVLQLAPNNRDAKDLKDLILQMCETEHAATCPSR